MKRMRVAKMDEMIDVLESIESGQGKSWYLRQAISYLRLYADSLGDRKTVRVKEVGDDA